MFDMVVRFSKHARTIFQPDGVSHGAMSGDKAPSEVLTSEDWRGRPAFVLMLG